MDDKKEIVHSSQYAIMPVMHIASAKERRDAIVEFVQEIMEEGRDFGIIPGTDKPTLLKPGAEKLTTFFGLSPSFELMERELDWTGRSHDGEPFFYFQYKCSLHRGDPLAGMGVGSCNSWEKKYRYRFANLVCPKCGQEAVIKGKRQYGGGWLCWPKKGGCGAKWPDGAEEIESQERGQVKNDNPQDIVNTIDKMAQKRALIAATLIAVNGSEFFTQDIEDMEIAGENKEPEKSKKKKAKKSGTEVPPETQRQRPDGPLTPAVLRSYIKVKADGYGDREASQNQRGLAMGMLNECFAGRENSNKCRHSVLAYLFDTDSGSDLTGGQVLALLDWLKPTKLDDGSGGYRPGTFAEREAQLVLRERLRELGQEELR